MGKLNLKIHRAISLLTQKKYRNISRTSNVDHTVVVYDNDNLIMAENTNIDAGALIMNTRAKFIMKKNSGSAIGLTVITGNHMSIVGRWFKSITDADKNQYDPQGQLDKDVVVEEDVWIASNVTLLSGVTVGRGAEIGAGSVVRKSIPPYAAVVGNPAKIVGFKFTPEETIEHEKALYAEEDRLPLELLEKNYTKYFLNRVKEIKEWTRQ